MQPTGTVTLLFTFLSLYLAARGRLTTLEEAVELFRRSGDRVNLDEALDLAFGDRLNLVPHDLLEQRLATPLGQETWSRERAAGATLTLDEAIVLARTVIGSTPRKERSASGQPGRWQTASMLLP